MSNVANSVERRNDSAVIVVALLIMKVAKTKHMIEKIELVTHQWDH
jgi:hypothetical protein